jgi:hypothetical protein
MSSSSLQQHLSKLVEPGPPRNYAIAAIFDVAARAAPSQHTEAAFLRCLALQDAAAVAVATERLVEMVVTGKYDMTAAQILVLSALAVAVPPTVVVLSDCATRLFAIKLEATSWRDGANELSRMPWIAHPLTKVIRAAPGAASTLVSTSCQMLLHAADKNTQETGNAAFDATLSAFHPFFLSALLHRGITAEHPEIPGMLHDALARVACALSHAPPAQTSLLRWMVRVLPLLPVDDTQSQALAVTCVYNVIDAIFACKEEPSRFVFVWFCYGFAGFARFWFFVALHLENPSICYSLTFLWKIIYKAPHFPFFSSRFVSFFLQPTTTNF